MKKRMSDEIIELAKRNIIMNTVYALYDFHMRRVGADRDDYQCGACDALGQVILDLGKLFGEEYGKPYKFEAYKRVMQFETVEKYIKDYPTPVKREVA